MRKITVSNDFFTGVAEALKQGQTVKLLIDGKGGIGYVFYVVGFACL
ncbi:MULTISPECIES: hypothetical protein [Bacteroides]|jgi:hypothetical protein|nr:MULTISPECIES: hypothetical protein [Bacteroides]